MTQDPLIGRRVRLTKHDFDRRFIGMTGRVVHHGQDGYVIEIDRPLPAPCLEYEDTRSGEWLTAGDDIAPISDSAPVHDGMDQASPNPMLAAMQQAIADNLGPEVDSITFATDDGHITSRHDLRPHRSAPDLT